MADVAPQFGAAGCGGNGVRSRVQGTVVLDQARLRGASRRFDAEAIELGNEPPLSVDGGTGGLIDRRRLSVQWFSGTILTGLCGAALMGGAVFASLDGETNFAAAPERVEMALRGAISGLGDRLSGLRKSRPAAGDQRAERDAPDRCAFRPSTRVRDRELVRTRALRARLRQSVADGVRSVRQDPAVQSAKASRRRGGRRRPDAGGGAGRRSVLRHLRSRRRRTARAPR